MCAATGTKPAKQHSYDKSTSLTANYPTPGLTVADTIQTLHYVKKGIERWEASLAILDQDAHTMHKDVQMEIVCLQVAHNMEKGLIDTRISSTLHSLIYRQRLRRSL